MQFMANWEHMKQETQYMSYTNWWKGSILLTRTRSVYGDGVMEDMLQA